MAEKNNEQKIISIKKAIENHVHPDNRRSNYILIYSNWYVGITNNTKLRKAQHERERNLKAIYFRYWDAGNRNNALEIEDYFHDKGMLDRKGGKGSSDSKFVYVFKLKKNPLDVIGILLDLL